MMAYDPTYKDTEQTPWIHVVVVYWLYSYIIFEEKDIYFATILLFMKAWEFWPIPKSPSYQHSSRVLNFDWCPDGSYQLLSM